MKFLGATPSGSTDITTKAYQDVLDPRFTYNTSAWYFTASPASTSTSATMTNGSARVTPWINPGTMNVTAWGFEVTVVGSTGAVVRGGIWNDDGNGRPGTLFWDAGTGVATAVSALVVTVVSVTIPPGLYWVGGAVQGAPTTIPTLRVTALPELRAPMMASTSTTAPAANITTVGYGMVTAQTGAFTTFGTVAPVGYAPRILLRT